MRIVTLIALLFATPASAQFFNKSADWTLVLRGEYGKYYIDTNSIKPRGKIIDFVMLIDLSKPDDGHLSSVWTQSMDCGAVKWKTKAIQFWTGNMAGGKIVDEGTFPPELQTWDTVHPMKNVDFYNLVNKLCSD